jgi:Polyketide cyclase / dehydrase and lipid transport
MAVRASREIVIEAPPQAILDALADIPTMTSWSPVHTRAEVIDTYPDGRPHHVRATFRVLGIVDREVLEYHWGPDWVVWDAAPTSQLRACHVEYNLASDHDGDSTRVRFDITLEPIAPVPNFLMRRGERAVLSAATKGLRKRVLG